MNQMGELFKEYCPKSGFELLEELVGKLPRMFDIKNLHDKIMPPLKEC
jgi:hypothetical protein